VETNFVGKRKYSRIGVKVIKEAMDTVLGNNLKPMVSWVVPLCKMRNIEVTLEAPPHQTSGISLVMAGVHQGRLSFLLTDPT
jgi:hypothetical protein